MNKKIIMKRKYAIVSFILFLLLGSTSCLKKGLNESEIKPKSEFDFATVKQLPVDLDLNLKDYAISVELYAENPIRKIVDGAYSSNIKDETIKPILRAITEKDGTLNDIVNIPVGTKVLYLYTNYIGLPIITPIVIKNGAVTLALKDQTKSSGTRAATRNNAIIPEGIKILGTWGGDGIPNYLSFPRNYYPAEALYSLNKAVFYTTSSGFVGTELLNDNFNTNITITKKTEINISYLGGSASMLNTLCYYHYPANEKPKNNSEVQLIVAFPNSTFPTVTQSGLSSGDNIMLKYWNSETKKFEDNFPAGETISFAILPSAFKRNTGDIVTMGNMQKFFSQPELNVTEDEGARSHCILLNDKKNGCFTFLFEDRPRKGNITDKYPGGDFRDAMFYVKSTIGDAINADNIPNLPDAGLTAPDETENFTEAMGTLIFEDLWPSEGDYDMNDAIIEYSSKIYRNSKNKVVKVIDTFKPVNKGGTIPLSFGYELSNVNRSQVSMITEPALASPSVFAIDASGMEIRQSKPTVIVFEDLQASIGKKITVTTTCLFPQEYKVFNSPYNPFIIKNDKGIRGTLEIHLTGHAPTSLADKTAFGTGDDRSDVTSNEYYISKNNMFPFAINIPILDFIKTTEGVRIDKEYPNFTNWVKTKGEESTNWYIK